jgi:hypothetical protein
MELAATYLAVESYTAKLFVNSTLAPMPANVNKAILKKAA